MHSHASDDTNSRRLYWAVFINVLLTVVQIVAGILSGSLSLIADALHNFSDAGALVVAAVARRISKLPGNETMTYGYRRAEIIGALINSTTLVLIGLYLVYECVMRYQNQEPIDGWTVVIVGSVALLIDTLTALLTYSGSKESLNIKAAFIHNVSDALASVVVIVSGILIIIYNVFIVDLIATVLISVYVLYQAYYILKKCILILMQSKPDEINIVKIKADIVGIDGVVSADHIHVWQMDEKKFFFEGHIFIRGERLIDFQEIKGKIRGLLNSRYSIDHVTLEIDVKKD